MGASCCGGHAPAPRAARDPLASAPGGEELSPAERKKLEHLAAFLADAKRSNIKLREGILQGSARVQYLKGKHAATAIEAAGDKLHAHLLTPPENMHDDYPGDHDHVHHRHGEGEGEARDGRGDAAARRGGRDCDDDSAESQRADRSAANAAGDACVPEPSLADRITYTLETMLVHQLLVRVERVERPSQGKAKHLAITPLQAFDPSEYYMLPAPPTGLRQIAMSLALVLVVLAGVMFPLWPAPLRMGVVYLSYALLGLIGLLFVLAIVRLVLYYGLLIGGRPGWLFPNLFADVGIIESFIPVWEWEAPVKRKAKAE